MGQSPRPLQLQMTLGLFSMDFVSWEVLSVVGTKILILVGFVESVLVFVLLTLLGFLGFSSSVLFTLVSLLSGIGEGFLDTVQQ